MDKDTLEVIIPTVFIIVIGLIILPQVANSFTNNSEYKTTVSTVVDNGNQHADAICSVPDEIIEDLNKIFAQGIQDEESRQQLQKISEGTATGCEVQEFFNILDSEQRKKITPMEFTCNVKSCVVP